ncbi:MarR family winged helix-turn-helix transcriptional regulator [Brevibacillus migulae]|uniref:MarR family winged helix-turn-helix transcriptional regulator n=1 Tax=Brevibacillus migulae TaxID=1644114 RepID=UPI00106E40BD|nr:MarR family transcriptional regulator [Brevibacillus migulae]
MEFDLRDLPTRATLQELSRKIPELDVSSVETALLFMRVATNVFHHIHDNLARFGISQGKFNLLMIFYKESDRSFLPSELAEKAGITRATVTGLLDGLEREGLVERKSHPKDRRMIMTRMTQKGIERMQAVLPDHFLLISRLMQGLTEEDRRMLISYIERIDAEIPKAEGQQ